MPMYKLDHYEVRPEAIADVERVMRDYATYVRDHHPRSSWGAYRDARAPYRFVAISRADDDAADDRLRDAAGTQVFLAALAPHVTTPIASAEYQLVTSSDLAPRVRAPGRRPSRRGPRAR